MLDGLPTSLRFFGESSAIVSISTPGVGGKEGISSLSDCKPGRGCPLSNPEGPTASHHPCCDPSPSRFVRPCEAFRRGLTLVWFERDRPTKAPQPESVILLPDNPTTQVTPRIAATGVPFVCLSADKNSSQLTSISCATCRTLKHSKES